MIPLYILGLLQRYGPQHGYQIKKIIAEQLSDFTQIKLPTIYYHLEKMQSEGLLLAGSEKPGSRPEKTVYSVTDKGREAFHTMLTGLLEFDYRPTFPSDGVFFFCEHVEPSAMAESLKGYTERLKLIIGHLERHRQETLKVVPPEAQTMVKIIFSHHMRHYQAELEWATESLEQFNIKEV